MMAPYYELITKTKVILQVASGEPSVDSMSQGSFHGTMKIFFILFSLSLSLAWACGCFRRLPNLGTVSPLTISRLSLLAPVF